MNPKRPKPKHHNQNGTSQNYTENSKGSKSKTGSLKQGNPHKAISWFFRRNSAGRMEWHDIFNTMNGETYNQQYSTQQGSNSNLMAKSKALHIS